MMRVHPFISDLINLLLARNHHLKWLSSILLLGRLVLKPSVGVAEQFRM